MPHRQQGHLHVPGGNVADLGLRSRCTWRRRVRSGWTSSTSSSKRVRTPHRVIICDMDSRDVDLEYLDLADIPARMSVPSMPSASSRRGNRPTSSTEASETTPDGARHVERRAAHNVDAGHPGHPLELAGIAARCWRRHLHDRSAARCRDRYSNVRTGGPQAVHVGRSFNLRKRGPGRADGSYTVPSARAFPQVRRGGGGGNTVRTRTPQVGRSG